MAFPLYKERDWEIINYYPYRLEGTKVLLRGPLPHNLQKNKYFVCVGAAQTVGCFCENPYANLLQEKLNMQVLNLSYGGAGPSWFMKQKGLINHINKAKFAIIQVMTARGESNELFDSKWGTSTLIKRSDGVKVESDDAYRALLEQAEPERVRKIVQETRNNWINNYRELLRKIKIPKILFWFSRRETNYQENYQRLHGLWGGFPQLVNQEMIDQIKNYSDEYVECISSRGLPQLLRSRFTGEPTTLKNGKTHNNYYPSPEMHIDAAVALEEVCRKYVETREKSNSDKNRIMARETSLQKTEKIEPEKAEDYTKLAVSQSKKGNVKGAIASYQKAIELNPKQPFWVYKSLGSALSRQQRYHEARSAWTRAIKIQPENAKIYTLLAISQNKTGDEVGAIASYQKAIELNEKQPLWVYQSLGYALSRQQRYHEAIDSCTEAIKIEPENAEIYTILARAQTKIGDIIGAIACYRKAIKLDPKQPNWVYKNLGDVLQKQGWHTQAEAAYKKARESNER